MKTIYLLPYEEYKTEKPFYHAYMRKALGFDYEAAGCGCHSQVWKNKKDSLWRITWNYNDVFMTLAGAMKALDDWLIEKGFYLIPEDQVKRFEEKLKLLL
jgi:hypothetical protein